MKNKTNIITFIKKHCFAQGTFAIACVFVGASLFSCNSEHEVPVMKISEKELCSVPVKSIHINEDSLLCGRIVDFIILPDSSFICTDGQKVVKYDATGSPIMTYGDRGHSGSEFVEAGKLFATEDYLYIWCERSLKLLRFRHDGTFCDHYQGPAAAISKFTINHDSIASYYVTGRGEHLIHEYSLTTNKQTGEYANVTNSDIASFFHPLSGAIGSHNGKTEFLHPTQMTLEIIDGAKPATAVYIDDPDFLCEELDYNPRESKATGLFQKMDEFVASNSVVTGLYSGSQEVYITAETGKYQNDAKTQEEYYAHRKIKVYRVPDSLDTVETQEMGYPQGMYRYGVWNDCLWGLMIENDGYEIKAWKLR